MKVTTEITNLHNLEAWSGAKETLRLILLAGKGDEFIAMIEELYPDGISDTELNDLLWFDDNLLNDLGIDTEE
jgi:hypothetical protein